MKRHITNAVCGVLDYASYPLGMLAVAPIILHRLGAAEYGLWMVTTSIISAGGIIASGFSDAGIQRVATLRGSKNIPRMMEAIRTMFTINLILGFLVAFVAWFAAPYAARHIARPDHIPLEECLACLRIASIMILIRAIETISVSTQRAFEDYRGTVLIAVALRIVTLSSAAILALFGRGMESIMISSAVLFAAATCLQFWHLRKFVDVTSLWPSFQTSEIRNLLGPGVFVWLEVIGGVLFRQVDRIVLGVSLGALAVTSYSLSIQLAEPLFGLTAAGLGFFFPYLSGRASSLSGRALKHCILSAFLCNVLLVLCGVGIMLLFGSRFLHLWAGTSAAQGASPILPFVIAGSALSGLSVTGVYAVQALGLFRTAAYISLGSRSVLLFLMLFLLHTRGLHGLAIARVCYGAAALLIYMPLIRYLDTSVKEGISITHLASIAELQREA